MCPFMNFKNLSDDKLMSGFSDLLIEESERLVLQLEYLVELERRKLFLDCPSLWHFLVHEKKMDDATAGRRIHAAKILARFPQVKEKLESGKLNLSLLEITHEVANREKLSDEDFSEVLNVVSGMSYKQAKRVVASMYPETIRRPRDQIRPLNDEFSEVRFVAPNSLIDELEEIRGLLAHSHPGATLAELFEILAREYRKRHHPEEKAKRYQERGEKELAQKETAQKEAIQGEPVQKEAVRNDQVRSTLRVPSHPLTHALVLRDGYQCSYRDPSTGRSCGSKRGLQIDHIKSWSSGGKTELGNLRFLCANHHRRVSFLEFGESSLYFKAKPG
jgi:5-methylcytosine-specific restriction endonuclease McrA